METEERIRQSQVRVRSGLRLVGFLVAVSVVAFLFGVVWVAQLSGVLAGFFGVVTLLEFWNVRRLSKRTTSE